MAIEKYIIGKKDSAKHDGLYANRKREQAADYQLEVGLEIYEELVKETSTKSSGVVYRQQGEPLPPISVDKRQSRDR